MNGDNLNRHFKVFDMGIPMKQPERYFAPPKPDQVSAGPESELDLQELKERHTRTLEGFKEIIDACVGGWRPTKEEIENASDEFGYISPWPRIVLGSVVSETEGQGQLTAEVCEELAPYHEWIDGESFIDGVSVLFYFRADGKEEDSQGRLIYQERTVDTSSIATYSPERVIDGEETLALIQAAMADPELNPDISRMRYPLNIGIYESRSLQN